jgi:hypothetical protein
MQGGKVLYEGIGDGKVGIILYLGDEGHLWVDIPLL